jgi:hypothetical protein
LENNQVPSLTRVFWIVGLCCFAAGLLAADGLSAYFHDYRTFAWARTLAMAFMWAVFAAVHARKFLRLKAQR